MEPISNNDSKLSFDFFEAIASVIRPIVQKEIRQAFIDQARKPDPLPDTMTLQECCNLTRYSKATIYSKTCRGQMPFMKVGGSLRFSRKKILEWMQGRGA